MNNNYKTVTSKIKLNIYNKQLPFRVDMIILLQGWYTSVKQ